MKTTMGQMARYGVSALLLLGVATMGRAAQAANNSGAQVVGYYDVFGGTDRLEYVSWPSLSVLNLAFAGINEQGECAFMPEDGTSTGPVQQDVEGTIRALVAARDESNPNTKLVLSVGGWTLSHGFSQVAGDTNNITTFSQSCSALVQKLGLDGLDIDWEYPTRLGAQNCPANQSCQSSNDAENFVALLAMLRVDLPKNSLLSAAVYYDPSKNGVAYDVQNMDAFLDHWNIMAYDMAAPQWHPTTANHASLAQSKKALQAFVAAGATPQKLILGVPLYGYIWTGVQAASPGAQAQGTASDETYPTLDLMARYSQDSNCALQSSDEGDAYFCSAGAHAGEWAGVEDATVLAKKAHYVRDNGYGGLMTWELSQDTIGGLTRVMAQELK